MNKHAIQRTQHRDAEEIIDEILSRDRILQNRKLRMSKDAFKFEQFLAVGGSYAPRVSIRSNGTLGLSQGLMHKHGLTKGNWCACLFFDAERRAIGIKFTQDENTQGAVKVHARSAPGKHGLTVGEWYAQLFFDAEKRAIGIKFTQNQNEQGAIKVHARSSPGKHGLENWSGHIAARAFLDYYSVEYENPNPASFRPEWNQGFGGLVVILGKTSGGDAEIENDLGADPPDGGDAGEEKTPS